MIRFLCPVRRPAFGILLAATVLAGACGAPPPAPTRPIELKGEIRLPGGAAPKGKVYVGLYHAWSLQGELRHPLQLIKSFEAAPGTFTHRFAYPESGGEGLVVYAWVDIDGDTVLCTPTGRTDLAGLTEVKEFPADKVSVVLDLTEPCRGPDWFYPKAPA
jgi:hypothetical protein